MLRKIDWSSVIPARQDETELCSKCRDIDIWAQGFKHSSELTAIRETAKTCGLCSLFHQSALKSGGKSQGVVEFRREESTLKHGPNGLPLLSIYVEPGESRERNPLR